MPIQPARIQFDPQGNAFSETYDDIYFNPDHAEGKTNHLFHRATRFDEQLEALDDGQPLIVGELGFGLALNFLGTWRKFKRLAPPNCRLHYVGLDVAPPSAEQLRQALESFDDWGEEAQQLLREWPGRVAGVHRLRLDRCDLTLHLGDIDDTLDGVQTQTDVWFLDGFAPDKNPAMWSARVAQQLFARTRPGGTLGSYTAAGHVRRALADAGFTVERLPGDPFKRHLVAATKPGAVPSAIRNRVHRTSRVAVIGAGWAGLSVADELHRRGHDVVITDIAAPGAGASGNLQAVCAPVLDAAASSRQDFYRSAFVLASRQYPRCGILRRPDTQKDADALRQAAAVFGDLDGWLTWREASPEGNDGLWMPTAGVADFAAFSRSILDVLPNSAKRWPWAVREIHRQSDHWQLRADTGETLEADAVVLACAAGVRHFPETSAWPLRTIRGQVTHARATPESETTAHAVVGEAYLCPAHGGVHSVGATFDPDDDHAQERASDHADNQRRAELTDHAWATSMDWSAPAGRVAFRCNSPDYLPMIGPVPDLAAAQAWFDTLPGNATPAADDWPTVPGLYAITALGSHGVISSALGAALIADALDDTPPPCSAAAALAIHPGRFLSRAAKRRQRIAFPS
ncbi:MAG: FAD-dependent 5-carboxymethylaminomethyl-2-thiouridine(34) oxidoreductase MnmC [Planctomycetota bacterium]